MSLCPNTIRALSRSHIAAPRTLLPFLYQTATIQRAKPTTRSIRRNISYRSNPPEDDIPFEDASGNLPPRLDELQAPPRKTTMTDTERAAFEKLYKTFKTQQQERAKNSNGEQEELDQIADEFYEEDEESSGAALDKVFDAVLKGSPRVLDAQRDARRAQYKKSNEPTASEKETPAPDTPQSRRKLAAKAEKDRIRKLCLEERDRVDRLIKTAPTDRALWNILDREVFEPLRKLDLDAAAHPPPKKESSKPTVPKSKSNTNNEAVSPTDKRILFPNYPHHLLTAIQSLRMHFPTSTLPLTLLPTIKSLGRSAYALGATTQLYKHLLRTAWIQQSSYTLIDTLLTDMESNIVEFDLGILEVLDAVLKEYDAAKGGKLGREMQLVYGMEMWGEGIRKVRGWRGVVAERLGVKVEKARVVERPERYVKEQDNIEMDGRGLQKVDPSVREGRGTGDTIPFVGGEQALEDPSLEDEAAYPGLDTLGVEDTQEDDADTDAPAKVYL